MRQLSPARALTLRAFWAFWAVWAIGFIGGLAAGCAPAPGSMGPSTLAAPAGVAVTQDLPNGRVQFRLQPGYPGGTAVTIPATVTATRGSVTGPVTARVLASGIGERGAASEKLVRDLVPASVTVTPGQPRTVTVSWDGRDTKGAPVPSDAYVIVLEFRFEDGTRSGTASAAATVQLGP
ncbi:MAG TPA: hypothetical protein VHG53_01690 [Candidatus Limnocylindria bacterium]|nr:hypothetical protein [Candidatus Limnocylindria bacterium]